MSNSQSFSEKDLDIIKYHFKKIYEICGYEFKSGCGSYLFDGKNYEYQIETYQKFTDRVKQAKNDFMNFILKIKSEGKTIVGNSCPGRSVTLLNYYDVGTDLIPYTAEQPTSLKLDMFLPGKLIPIVNNQILINEQPDYVVLLAWHYAQPIMDQLKERGLKSNFIIPLPDMTLLEN